MGVIAESNDFLKTLITVVFTGSSTNYHKNISVHFFIYGLDQTFWIP